MRFSSDVFTPGLFGEFDNSNSTCHFSVFIMFFTIKHVLFVCIVQDFLLLNMFYLCVSSRTFESFLDVPFTPATGLQVCR